MKLRSLDLNLLLVFKAVYAERSISKAAKKLNLSQPAVSNALNRLRRNLDDPLFTRTPHAMVPTSRAKTLAGPIHKALELLEAGMFDRDPFDCAESDRRFVVAVEDYGETVLLPALLSRLTRIAPHLKIVVRPEPGGELAQSMTEGKVDLSLDYFVQRDSAFRNECVLVDSLLTLSRRDHPGVGDKLSLEQYLAIRHVALIPRAGSMPMIDLALAKRGLRRDVAVNVPHFLSMPNIVKSTDLLCTLPTRMALIYVENFQLRKHAVPLRVPNFPIYLTWHRSADDDPAHQWLREEIANVCQSI